MSSYPLSASPAEASPTFSYNFGSTSPATYSSPPSVPQEKKKRSHGKARPEGHIKRPPNSFIIFRTEYIKAQGTHSTPEVSKALGDRWRSMTAAEKLPWKLKSAAEKRAHEEKYPDYKYKPVHPRDADGKCIRKPRKPNQPRVKATTATVDHSPAPYDTREYAPAPYAWMDRKADAEFPSIGFPSDSSSASSPPLSPSPAPSMSYAQPSYQGMRRSSSVPLPGTDDRFFMGMPPQQGGYMYPPSPSGAHTGPVSRRLSKRPSTSMDFACAGPLPGAELYTAPPDFAPWRPNHRRSISAPMYGGEIPVAQFAQAPSHAQAPIDLTPINPDFGNVFAKFSWNTTEEPPFTPIVPPQHPYTGLDIPSMSHSPLSNGSATPPAATPSSPAPSHTPAIQQPAPLAPFDFSGLQAQLDPTPQAYAPAAQDVYHHADPAYGAQPQQFYAPEAAQPAYAPLPDLSGYEEGLRYTDADAPLHFNELIVEGY